MAVPAEITVPNITGMYTLNSKLSDSSQAVLKMQRVNFLVRQAVAYSTLTVTLKQYTDDDGIPHLDQYQHTTGGMKNFEGREMNWGQTSKHNWIWGKVDGKSRYTTLDEVEDPYLREGWENMDGEVVEGYVESPTDAWSAQQIWGFAMVDGVRRHVRRILAKRPGHADQRIRMVYDWHGPA